MIKNRNKASDFSMPGAARKPHRLAYAVRAKNIVNKVHLGWRVWSGEYSLQGSRDALATGGEEFR